MADEQSDSPAEPARLSVLHWRAAKKTPAWAFNGAAAGNRWETSAQVEQTTITEEAYDAAIERASGRQ